MKKISKAELFGYLGLFFLMIGLFSDDIIILRSFNIIATLFYIIQSFLMNSSSLVWTNFIIMGINICKVIQWCFF